jgi:hypothetical protein
MLISVFLANHGGICTKVIPCNFKTMGLQWTREMTLNMIKINPDPVSLQAV